MGGMLFALTHLRTFHPTTTTHPTCVYNSLVNDTHMVGLVSDMLAIFL